MSEMTSEQLAQGVVKLALSMQGAPHITPGMVEQALGGPVEFGTAEPQLFGKQGGLVEGGRYEAVTVPVVGPPQRFDIEFKPIDEDGKAPCVQAVGPYHERLVNAGFAAKWIAAPRLGSHASWSYRRGDVRVIAYVGKSATQDQVHACVASIDISITR